MTADPGAPATAGSRTSSRSLRTILARRVLRPLARVQEQMAGVDRLELLALMGLVLVLLHTSGPAEIPVQVVALVGLLYRPSRLAPALWLLLGGLSLVGSVGLYWWELVNHKYLIMYWCLAFGLALMTRDRERVLAGAARLMVALVFVSAVAWKVTNPEFTSGAFFEFTLLTDTRFQGLAEVVGGLPPGAAGDNLGTIERWSLPSTPMTPTPLQGGERIAGLAQVMTVWTLLIEGLVAVLFVLPGRRRVRRLAEIALLAFVATTYGLAPVVGFGWILLILGFAQTSFTPRVAHVLYPALFVGVLAASLSSVLWSIAQLLPL